jgi:hypothetical protein
MRGERGGAQAAPERFGASMCCSHAVLAGGLHDVARGRGACGSAVRADASAAEPDGLARFHHHLSAPSTHLLGTMNNYLAKFQEAASKVGVQVRRRPMRCDPGRCTGAARRGAASGSATLRCSSASAGLVQSRASSSAAGGLRSELRVLRTQAGGEHR